MESKINIEQIKRTASEIARDLINNKVHMVIGCRKIQKPLEKLGLRSHPNYTIFIVVDSEADRFPIGEEQRSLWDKDALRKKDEEYMVAVAGYEPEVKNACHKLLSEIG